MASLMKKLGIDRLTLEDRIALMHELWNNIAAESGRPPLSDSLRRKLEHRLTEQKANPKDVIAWEQIRAEALARSSCRKGMNWQPFLLSVLGLFAGLLFGGFMGAAYYQMTRGGGGGYYGEIGIAAITPVRKIRTNG